MSVFKRAARWWVFLPLAPIVLAMLLEYWGRIFYHLRLYRLLGVVGMLSVVNAVLLLPYMALASAIFHPRLGLSFWPLVLELGAKRTDPAGDGRWPRLGPCMEAAAPH